MNILTPRVKRSLVIGAVGLGALGLAAHNTEAANATETPATKTVAWVVTSPAGFAGRFDTPQRLATTADTCGVIEQVDVYRYDTPEHQATVDALIAHGTLSSSAEDGSVWISNQDVTLPACEPTAPPTAPPTTPPVTAPPTPSATSSAPPSAPSSTPSAPAPTPSSTRGASPVRLNVTATTAAPIAGSDSLAYTGTPSWQTALGIILGGAMVLAGVALLARAAIIRRRRRATRR